MEETLQRHEAQLQQFTKRERRRLVGPFTPHTIAHIFRALVRHGIVNHFSELPAVFQDATILTIKDYIKQVEETKESDDVMSVCDYYDAAAFGIAISGKRKEKGVSFYKAFSAMDGDLTHRVIDAAPWDELRKALRLGCSSSWLQHFKIKRCIEREEDDSELQYLNVVICITVE